MRRIIVIVMLFCTLPALATTWYVRPDGGTRYSSNNTKGQCNGKFNAGYAGTGVNQNCAYSDVRYLWSDGTASSWGWVGAGGDTYLINCPNDCRVGYSGPNDSPGDYFLGVPGDPYSSGAPIPFSGTAGAHTKILGWNYASCSSDSVKARLNGGYGVLNVFNLKGVSNVDIACFDITDHSNCGRQGQLSACSTSYPLSDYATNGIATSNKTTDTTITDVNIHGMANSGMLGATGNGVSLLRVALVGNASSGWNMDDGTGATGTGSLNMSYVSLLWNGCAEEYPIVDPVPYQDCTDDNNNGYGDGIGTATAVSNPAWHMTITNSIAAYNTQDGFDLLHLQGGGSSLTIMQSLAHSNMGQQLKVGSASIVRNNLLIGNCNAMRQLIPGTPAGYNSRLSDFCRAADTAVVVEVQDSLPTYFQFNTLYTANATGLEIECNSLAPCTNLSQIKYEDNVFVGFPNNRIDGYPAGGNGNYANPIYLGVSGLFSHPGSTMNYNVTYHPKSNATCPAATLNETNGICVDPQLIDETLHLYGYGNMAPVAGSRIIGAGLSNPDVLVDYAGATRPRSPSVGALEYGSQPQGNGIVVIATPNPSVLSQPITLTVTVAKTGTTIPTGSVNFSNGSEFLGSAGLDSTGTATLVVSWLPVGSYAVVGAYSGDSNYSAEQSGAMPLQVLSPTTINLATSSVTPTVGSVFILTATVQGSGAGVPTGTVNFMSGTTVLGTGVVNGSGLATLSTTLLMAGRYSLTAQYSGSASFLASISAAILVTPQTHATTTTTLTVSSTSPMAGSPLTLVATLKGTGGLAPAGTVNFMSGAAVLGTSIVDASGVTTLSIASLVAGTYSITAVYSGDGNFAGSTSAAVSLVVTSPGSFTFVSTPSSISVGSGAAATSSITVASISGFSGTVNLTCSVSPEGTALAPSCSIAPGSATLTAGATATAVATIATGATQNVAAIQRISFKSLGEGGAMFAVLFCLVPFRRRRAIRSLMASLVILVGLSTLSGCGSGGSLAAISPVSSSSTYTVTVTGTGTAIGSNTASTASTVFNVTVR